MTKHDYKIADWVVSICFDCENNHIGMHLLPSFEPFSIISNRKQAKEDNSSVLFTMTVDMQMPIAEGDDVIRVKVCNTGNGDIVVDRLPEGGYQFLIKNILGEECALMQSNTDFSKCYCRVLGDRSEGHTFGLNNAMMLAYAFAGATRGTLLVHASLVRHEGLGYAFVAKSGTGKSTQTSNWLKVIPNCDLMNDDNPVVRVSSTNQVVIYGSPWSGKTPCYRQVSAPLGAITKIARDPDNYVTRMQPLLAFNELLSSCSVMKWDKKTYRGVCDTVTTIVEQVPIYTLHCTADPISATICHEAIRSHR